MMYVPQRNPPACRVNAKVPLMLKPGTVGPNSEVMLHNDDPFRLIDRKRVLRAAFQHELPIINQWDDILPRLKCTTKVTP